MEQWEQAYRKWRKAVERGYGHATNVADLKKIDARIVRLRDEYERLLREYKDRTQS